jgi:RNA polymerase sigma-70 factor (ECF subfamily)
MAQKIVRLLPSLKVDESEAQRVAAPRAANIALPEIFQQHAPFLWRTLMNMGVPRHDAQDLCQEVMLIVHRRLADFDGQSLRGWLYGICVRVASDYRRSARVRREIPHGTLPVSAMDADQTDTLERRQSLESLLRALDRLGEEQRAAFVLYEVEELTLAEVSEALGVPLQTVYSRIKAARQALRLDLVRSGVGGAREAG